MLPFSRRASLRAQPQRKVAPSVDIEVVYGPDATETAIMLDEDDFELVEEKRAESAWPESSFRLRTTPPPRMMPLRLTWTPTPAPAPALAPPPVRVVADARFASEPPPPRRTVLPWLVCAVSVAIAVGLWTDPAAQRRARAEIRAMLGSAGLPAQPVRPLAHAAGRARWVRDGLVPPAFTTRPGAGLDSVSSQPSFVNVDWTRRTR
jgi:hypothetical protein